MARRRRVKRLNEIATRPGMKYNFELAAGDLKVYWAIDDFHNYHFQCARLSQISRDGVTWFWHPIPGSSLQTEFTEDTSVKVLAAASLRILEIIREHQDYQVQLSLLSYANSSNFIESVPFDKDLEPAAV